MSRLFARTFAAALFLCAGCIPLHVTLQAAEGQLALLAARRPIAGILAERRGPRRVRRLLAEIERVKRFGEANGLRPTENYQDYVQLHRPAVVWVVSACEPLRFIPKTWSFPIAGSFPYLGWFDLQSARDYTRDLEEDGWDADLRSASAYSTLGWFRDPVLSTMISPGPAARRELVDVVLHESVHATLYVEGQGPFNESLASFVAGILTDRYLGRAAPKDPRRAAQEQVRRALHDAYGELEALYASAAPDDEKRARKAISLAALKERLAWKRRLNNATLLGYRTYDSGQVGFPRLLANCQGDLRCFLDRVRTLTPAQFARPHQEDFDGLVLGLLR